MTEPPTDPTPIGSAHTDRTRSGRNDSMELATGPDAAAGSLIDGFSLEELSDYLDAGRTPVRPDIESSPEARHALTRLERIHTLTGELLTAESASAPPPEESWFQGIIRGLSREVRAGRSVPLISPNPRVELTVSEGALRALVRDAGDTIPGAIIERTQFNGDLTNIGAPITVNIDVTAYTLTPLPDLADRVRAAASKALATQTELVIAGIDITITDIHTIHQTEETS